MDDAVQSVLSAQQCAMQTQIQTAVAARQLSAVKQQGQALVELIAAAANVGKAPGSGENFDAQG